MVRVRIMKPLISVIVPIYNCEKYLERCVDSIIGQTYENLEIFLIDDGSTDSSLQICERYKIIDDRIIVFTKLNEGQGIARNMGLDACSGEYISFVDSDDYIEKDMLETLYKELLKENAQLAICAIAQDNDFRLVKNALLNERKVFTRDMLIEEYIVNKSIHTGPCNKLYDRKLFTNIRFPNFRAREDVFIMHELFYLVNKAVYIPSFKYIQYINPSSTEQKKFSPHKLHLLDSEVVLLDFIKREYPQYLSLVQFQYMQSMVDLIKDLISSHSYSKYKQIYEVLFNLLHTYLAENKNLFNINPTRYRYYIRIDKMRTLFFLSNILIGFIRSIKIVFRKLIFR